MKSKWMKVGLGIVMLVNLSWAGSSVVDKDGAMILTRANLLEKGKGEVLDPVLNSIRFTHYLTDNDKGLMLFDAQDPDAGAIDSIRPKDGSDHEISNRILIEELRKKVGQDKLKQGFDFLSFPILLTGFESKRPLNGFLLERAQRFIKKLPQGSQSSIENKLEDLTKEASKPGELKFPQESILLQLGTREDIKNLEEQYRRSEGKAIFSAHYSTLPFEIVIYEAIAGVPEDGEKELVRIPTLDIRYHTEAKVGAVVMDAGILKNEKTKTSPVYSVKVSQYKGQSIYEVEIDAHSFIDEFISKHLPNSPKLSCIKPDQGKEYLSACIEKTIHATFRSPFTNSKIADLPTEGEKDQEDSSSSVLVQLKKFHLEKGSVKLLLRPDSIESRTRRFRVELSMPREKRE